MKSILARSQASCGVISSSRRKGVALDSKKIVAALKLLKANAVRFCAKTRQTILLPYSNKKFKAAPRWGEAARYIEAVSKILDDTNGNNVSHTSMLKGITEWDENNFSADIRASASFTIRAIIGQMINHKQKDLSH